MNSDASASDSLAPYVNAGRPAIATPKSSTTFAEYNAAPRVAETFPRRAIASESIQGPLGCQMCRRGIWMLTALGRKPGSMCSR